MDKMEGVGRIIHPGFYYYEGEWLNGKASGYGRCSDLENGHHYQGGFLDDLKYGSGYEQWKDYSCYEGEYEKGFWSGNGHMKWADGQSYKGGFKNGLKHGKGTYIYPSGNEYIGDYRLGMKHGTGYFHWKL